MQVFEEQGFPAYNISFHGGFGLVNIYGVPKPTFRAFELLAETGHVRVHHKKYACYAWAVSLW